MKKNVLPSSAGSKPETNPLPPIDFKATMAFIEKMNRLEVEYQFFNELRLKNQAYNFLKECGMWDEFQRHSLGASQMFNFI